MNQPNFSLEEKQARIRQRYAHELKEEGEELKKVKRRFRPIPEIITYLPRPETIRQDLRTIPHSATYTEFELQADTWWRLNGDGFYTRGEVDSETGRLDLVVYFNPQIYLPLALIEAKRKRHSAWAGSLQGKKYLALEVPIILYWKYEQYGMLVRKLMHLRLAARKDHRYAGEAPFPMPFETLSHAPVGLAEIVEVASQLSHLTLTHALTSREGDHEITREWEGIAREWEEAEAQAKIEP